MQCQLAMALGWHGKNSSPGLERAGCGSAMVPIPTVTGTMPGPLRFFPMGSQPPAGHRVTSLVLPPALAQHVDSQAERFAISKAAYLRQLIARDRETQARATAAAQG